jgi:2-haloacid dehalogenase
MIKNIIFDLGGVLIGWSPKNVYRRVFKTEGEVEWFLDNICTMDWNEQQDGGKTIAEAEAELISEHPKWEREIKIYYEQWHEMLTGPIYGTVEILQKLERLNAHKLYALTNWSAELFPYARKHYHFLNGFRGILVSGEDKLKKPDPAIYQLILNRYGLVAEECIFIDDNLRNIEASRKMGIHSIHFKSPQALRQELLEKYEITV